MYNATSLFRAQHLRALAATLVLAVLAVPARASTRPFSAQKPADPSGSVEVINVAGSIEIVGWDKPMVDVSGNIGSKVERVEVTTNANRTTVRVLLPSGSDVDGEDGSAHLKIQVPQKSELEVSLVSSDLKVSGVTGNQHLQTVSGDIAGQVDGDVQVNTVSGDVHLSARNSHNAQFKTVSGDVGITGADGTIEGNTVSGDMQVSLGAVSRAHFASVSGDIGVTSASLSPSGQFEATSVSGDIQVRFVALPDADVDIQTFSGDIRNCFGPKPVAEQYGPGNRLSFRNGKGGGHLHIDSKSGDVQLCGSK